MGGSVMADTTKFKSVGIDLDTYEKIKAICDKERRSIRQQIGIIVDREYDNHFKKEKVTSLGLGAINSLHSRD
jgi:hypothetical protein